MLNYSIKVLGDDFRRIQHMALFIQHVAAKYGMVLSFQSRRERRISLLLALADMLTAPIAGRR